MFMHRVPRYPRYPRFDHVLETCEAIIVVSLICAGVYGLVMSILR